MSQQYVIRNKKTGKAPDDERDIVYASKSVADAALRRIADNITRLDFLYDETRNYIDYLLSREEALTHRKQVESEWEVVPVRVLDV